MPRFVQAIIWTSDGLLSARATRSEFAIKFNNKKMTLKMSLKNCCYAVSAPHVLTLRSVAGMCPDEQFVSTLSASGPKCAVTISSRDKCCKLAQAPPWANRNTMNTVHILLFVRHQISTASYIMRANNITYFAQNKSYFLCIFITMCIMIYLCRRTFNNCMASLACLSVLATLSASLSPRRPYMPYTQMENCRRYFMTFTYLVPLG